MRLDLFRFRDTGAETLGVLMVNGVFQSFTLEDTYRKTKIPGRTRISEGLYNIGWHQSAKFGATAHGLVANYKGMPHVLNVPNFSYILIHWGNHHRHTDGCILVGKGISGHSITNSRDAFRDLYRLMVNEKDITLSIQDLEF